MQTTNHPSANMLNNSTSRTDKFPRSQNKIQETLNISFEEVIKPAIAINLTLKSDATRKVVKRNKITHRKNSYWKN